MSKPVPELDIKAAIEYSRQCREQEKRGSLPAFQAADCMTSGLSGPALAAALRRHFPDLPRGAVYDAIGYAASIWQADLTLAHMEIELLRQHGGRLPVEGLA